MIAKDRADAFWRDGFLVAENAVDRRQLARLREVLAGWVEEIRDHGAPFGERIARPPRAVHCCSARPLNIDMIYLFAIVPVGASRFGACVADAPSSEDAGPRVSNDGPGDGDRP